jgi:two-component system phosphate regulon sensor histidine kinase PhoR
MSELARVNTAPTTGTARSNDDQAASQPPSLPHAWTGLHTVGLTLLVLGTPLTALTLWTIASPTWTTTPANRAMLIALAVLLMACPGAAVLRLASQYRGQLRRLIHDIEQIDPKQQSLPNPPRAFGLSPLTEAIDHSWQTLREELTRRNHQRRDLEVSLRVCESERGHLTAVLNAITDPVIVTDAFNEVVLANEAAATALGFDLHQVRGQPVDEVLVDSELVRWIKETRRGNDPSLRRNVEHEIAGEEHTTVYEVDIGCVASEKTAAPIEQRNAGGCGGIVTVMRDITREKEIAQMKSQFVSNVSHELRTPLSSIKAYMEMLVDGEAQDEQTRRQFYNTVQSETNRLSRLIDNILSINRIETGVVKLQREYVSIKELTVEAVDVMQPQAQAKQIELVGARSPVCCQVWADRDMMMQAVLNLIGNAIKYTPEQGRVHLTMEVDEHAQTVTVSVTDTGHGIAESDIPHLFDKFYRVADHKKVAKGTGLGLNLVKHVVETVHAGTVHVQSKLGQGSTFAMSLPMPESEDGE